MNTAFSVLESWRDARRQATEALAKSEAAVDEVVRQEVRVARLLRNRGPIVHSRHVYSFRNGQIVCEPCVDSILLDLEDGK